MTTRPRRTTTPLARVSGLLACATSAVAALGVSATPALAHQNPSGCDSNSVDVTPTRDKLLVRNGDVIKYTVSLRNVNMNGQQACDLSDATVILTLPAADGTPTGRKVTLASDADYPVGTAMTFPGTTNWTVAVNPGVRDAVVMVEVNGTLHDAPVDHAASIKKTLGTTVTQPHTTLSVTASPTVGRAPLAVTYTYVERNDSSTDVPISGVAILDSTCSPVTHTAGDTNGNGILDTGENWTFTCTKTVTSGGAVTSNVVGKGTSTLDNRAVEDELASVIVTVAQPQSVLTKTATPARGAAPLTVVYLYSYTNTGKDTLSNLHVTDDKCAPVNLTGGDTNRDALVQPGERWTFGCTKTFASPGTFVNVATATAIDTVDHQPVAPLTARAEVTVAAAGTHTSVTVAPETQPSVLGNTVHRNGAPAKAPKVAPSFFARTGARILVTALAGLAAIALGAAMVGAARRRRSGPTT